MRYGDKLLTQNFNSLLEYCCSRILSDYFSISPVSLDSPDSKERSQIHRKEILLKDSKLSEQDVVSKNHDYSQGSSTLNASHDLIFVQAADGNS